jgi:uncharacterized protein YdiU (UPF0061 family)
MRRSITDAGWRFDNSYARLPEPLWSRTDPTAVRSPAVVLLNAPLATELGLDPETLREAGAGVVSGNELPPGAEPIAQAYAGHQFGHFTNLGDGRAILLGEQLAPDGRRVDLQLKGAGRTRYSRGGDGRAALGPMLREHVIGEAMHALGIPTTRSLAVATTGEVVMREAPLPGAVLTRVAASHIRVGTFEYARALGDHALLTALLDHAIARHDPELDDIENPALPFLESVIERQAALVARWMLVGFVHGVMNTDNMAVSGETIDYGPCAFLDTYDPATVFSSIDRQGRYAYANQPGIAHWNLARLAECLLPLMPGEAEAVLEAARSVLDTFPERFERHRLAGARAKLGRRRGRRDSRRRGPVRRPARLDARSRCRLHHHLRRSRGARGGIGAVRGRRWSGHAPRGLAAAVACPARAAARGHGRGDRASAAHQSTRHSAQPSRGGGARRRGTRRLLPRRAAHRRGPRALCRCSRQRLLSWRPASRLRPLPHLLRHVIASVTGFSYR